MYFHNSLIRREAYFLLPLESKQEATSGWNFTKCISEVTINQLKVKNMHVRMGISTFNYIYGMPSYNFCKLFAQWHWVIQMAITFLIDAQIVTNLVFNRPVSHSARHQHPARERHIMRIASRENVDNQAPRNTNFTQ